MRKLILVPKALILTTLFSIAIVTPLFADEQSAVALEDLRSLDPAQRLEIVESVALNRSENSHTNMTINIAIRNIEQAIETHELEDDSFLLGALESLNTMKGRASDQQNMISMVVTGEPASYCVDQCGDGIFQEIVCLETSCPCAETPESCSVDFEEHQINNGKAIASTAERYQHVEDSSSGQEQSLPTLQSSVSQSNDAPSSSGATAGTAERVLGEELYRAQKDVVNTGVSLAERSVRYSVVKPAEAYVSTYESIYKEAFRGAQSAGREVVRTAERVGREVARFASRVFGW